jgi:hypothetical protein
MIDRRFRFEFQILDPDSISVILAKWKKVELADLDKMIQFSYKVYLHASQNKKVVIFWK